jgi:hypothetical protein
MLLVPTIELIAQSVQSFNLDSHAGWSDQAVSKVIAQWPLNSKKDEVLAKVAVLNALYSTNIYALHTLAEHIVGLDIDKRLDAGDIELVPEVARILIAGKKRCLLSFASKYCSWHRPLTYQMYDGNVHRLLCAYQRQEKFSDFQKGEPRDYRRFMKIITDFREHFQLEQASRKELDQFLWMQGRKAESLAK